MPLSDRTQIERDRLSPRIVQLWQALAPLQSVVSFMNTGAHPDDETTAMLAAMGFRDGIDLSYACSTRGEGGQNVVGTEATEALGVMRTAEMERACDVLNMRMYWLSETPDDTIFDFGFSKSGVETMGKWDRARTLKRFVDILRLEKPDIICPTFLDIPGQHGHHRAMTEAAIEVMALCGDPKYTESPLPPWQVQKLYLPAWSGAGQSYDDDLPPPPATLTFNADGIDPITGHSYERIAQQSRVFHQSQGMGRWFPAGSERNWPLHLAKTFTTGPDESLQAGLPQTMRDLDGSGLNAVQDHLDAARYAFPNFSDVLHHACQALRALDQADIAPLHAHKRARKRSQVARVIQLAAGVEIRGHLARDVLAQTDKTQLYLETRAPVGVKVATTLALPQGWALDGDAITLTNAAISDPYPAIYLPFEPATPCIRATISAQGVACDVDVPLDVPPLVVAQTAASLSLATDVVNLREPRREITLKFSDIQPETATPTFVLPDEWQASADGLDQTLTLPNAPDPARYCLPLTLNGQSAQTNQVIEHPHIDPRALCSPAKLDVLVVDAALPDVKIGYVGGGKDRVDHWMTRLGCDVVALDAADLASDHVLQGLDTIVIGIFALRFRPDLVKAMLRLHQWCMAGGTLLTLYHRPWDNWNKDTTAPAPLEIGQPSLRWRVTDETATVTHLLADHPALTYPNQITKADWEGWHKERGLYFAKSWDDAYTPLLEMADPDEAPHHGALLSADIGTGRHIHCALILHHQMEKLVPGAFRLMANLVAKRQD